MKEINGRYRFQVRNGDSKYVLNASIDVDTYNLIHDCYVDVLGFEPSSNEVYEIYKAIPENIKLLGNTWGWNDTEVGDLILGWIRIISRKSI